MDELNIVRLLERLGCNKIRKTGDEISCSCPFSSNHKRGDRRPSFGSKIDSESSSPYNCFSCGERGTMEGLAIQSGNSDLVPDYKPRKITKTTWNHTSKKNDQFGVVKGERKVLFKDVYLKPFLGVLSGFIKKRGITVETAKKWELGLDERFHRAIFTVREHTGHLAVVIGRDVTGDPNRSKYSNYVLDTVEKELIPYYPRSRPREQFIGPTKKFFLYGEHIIWKEAKNPESVGKDLFVVEGPMDVLAMWQFGYMALGAMGSYPSSYQIEKMVSMVPRRGRLVVMADGDKAGEILTEGIAKGVGRRVPVYDANLDPGMDPSDSSREEIEHAIRGAKIISLTHN